MQCLCKFCWIRTASNNLMRVYCCWNPQIRDHANRPPTCTVVQYLDSIRPTLPSEEGQFIFNSASRPYENVMLHNNAFQLYKPSCDSLKLCGNGWFVYCTAFSVVWGSLYLFHGPYMTSPQWIRWHTDIFIRPVIICHYRYSAKFTVLNRNELSEQKTFNI
jgi:hypothetical protein